ncbi:PREDICTED: probable serine/threonine-protein kinase DDB_G0282963 isoform X3 [Trachymyrmex septentrionalis]|uniref:probable serine/threonine-protein kinase DDB_G0282963 isoform X3 n=1 Tax=Trachymyrmex septentrionalis TaxID=34720 RepID=UPI00084F0B2E|nr:PREDICTED: probable serine/threonine-protein kinase DDB_G0282963 isoform X3 [Trachymyrmex septentrionalis]
MSTADTALSISIKMAPGPEHRQEPVAPDKITESDRAADAAVAAAAAADVVIDIETVNAVSTSGSSNSNNNNDDNNNVAVAAVAVIAAEQSSNIEIAPANFAAGAADSISQSSPLNSGADSKQEESTTLSMLNDKQLRDLLDEAITYKCPKDREGKSKIFKELLLKAEADDEKGRRVIPNSRCFSGSNRKRQKGEYYVSETDLTHVTSLQELARSEFDHSFNCGKDRSKNKKQNPGPSVSARQREGGSLPSNVNASHNLASLANLDLIFDKKSFCEERPAYDWTNKEKSKSLDKPSYISTKKEEKEKEKKELKRDTANSSGEAESETREKRISKGKFGTNEMLESDNPPPEYKSDYMVIDLGDVEVGAISERNVGSTASGIQRPRSLDTENDEGTELKIIEPRKPIQQYVTRASFDIGGQTSVDTTIEFPIRDHKQEKSKMSVNGTEVTGALFQPHNSVKCGIGGASNGSSTSQSKIVPSLCSVMPASWQTQNITMEGPRYTTQHITMKDPSVSGEKKSLDENGNAVQPYNGERKKPRRKHTQEHNVKVYNAENVEGHRNEDIDSLINFIENKESKNKKGKTGNPVRVKTSSGTKPRTREKDTKREQLPSKLKKSNSLEEISKTKLEDLTTEKSPSSSGASSVSSQHGVNIALRRPKQRSTGDATVDSRGDRRSWGTEEGQSIYCNDTGEDYMSRRNSNKKINPEPEHETEFLVVTKKKKSKKQRRSSSGSRAQNLTTSGSYLQNSRGFSNDYRTPLSPELRRKSASSMPPSDKSADSSDLDSVHSLPVTSNTSKHNLSKVATSSGGTPQASYADIARMATINMPHNLTMSAMLNTSSWPSVPPKTFSEPDKVPQDYYPSLDELQHPERKARQQQTQSNHAAASLSLAFEKPLSPTLTKMKNSSDRKKAEAQEEAINKNIQVFKYVQDIEKMHESLTQATDQKEQKNVTSSNYSSNSNETIMTNTVIPKYNNNGTTMNYNPVDTDNNPNCTVNNKDSVTLPRANNPRSRRNYVHSNQNVQTQGSHEEQHIKKSASSYNEEAIKKSHNTDTAQSENKASPTIVPHDCADAQKLKTAKPMQDSQSGEPESSNNKMTSGDSRSARVTKEYQNTAIKHDATKVGICQSQNSKQDNQQRDEADNKKTKSHNTQPDKDQSQRPSVETQQIKNSTPRPAVILLDETSSDIAKNNNLPTELTFGFEINELLLSEDNGNEETPTIAANPVFSPTVPPLVNKPPPNNFERNPPLFTEKPVRYDKFSNYHMQQPNAHVTPANVHPVMVQPLPYMGYPTRFAPPTYLPPPPPPPPGIIEKFHPPKEDFSMLYVAPEEELNVQTYNHDKIVSFVGLAWDAVMKEMPVTTGRIQFYSGQ